MAAVIIRKKDVERLGKEVLKEVYNFLHDEYILSNFEEMNIKKVEYVAMKDNGFNIEKIYHFLLNLNLDNEIDEDLYFKTKAFLDIFRVFDNDYIFLED